MRINRCRICSLHSKKASFSFKEFLIMEVLNTHGGIIPSWVNQITWWLTSSNCINLINIPYQYTYFSIWVLHSQLLRTKIRRIIMMRSYLLDYRNHFRNLIQNATHKKTIFNFKWSGKPRKYFYSSGKKYLSSKFGSLWFCIFERDRSQ